MLPAMRRILPRDPELHALEQNVCDAIAPLLKQSDLPRVFLKGVILAAGGTANTINHGLGKALQGYRVVLKDSNASIWDGQAANSFPDRTLVLYASAPCTVSLEVF